MFLAWLRLHALKASLYPCTVRATFLDAVVSTITEWRLVETPLYYLLFECSNYEKPGQTL